MIYKDIDDGRTVVARKDHRCEWCGQMIHKGESCIKRFYKFDGDLNNARQHPECFEAMQRDPASLEGFEGGHQMRGRTSGETEEARYQEWQRETGLPANYLTGQVQP